jgi:hypothetical protein
LTMMRIVILLRDPLDNVNNRLTRMRKKQRILRWEALMEMLKMRTKR